MIGINYNSRDGAWLKYYEESIVDEHVKSCQPSQW
jgi:hypothetical protein